MTLDQDSISNFTKQRILNYERSLIQSPFDSLPQPTNNHKAKYSVFELNMKIKQLIKNQPHNLRWVGNGITASIETYFYCLLMLSVFDAQTFIMFKSVFYELCRKYLEFHQQKLLVQFFCLLEFQSDKYLFLKKYPTVENIIVGLLNRILKEKKMDLNSHQQEDFDPWLSFNKNPRKEKYGIQSLSNQNSLQIQKIEDVYSQLSENFGFIHFKKSSEQSFQLRNDKNQKIFIIVEKQYFFVLQVLDENQISPKKSKITKGDLSEVQRLLQQDSNKKRITLQTKQSQHKYQKNNLFKNHFKPAFLASKLSPKHEKALNNQSIRKQNQNQQQYLDLMESSFQQSESEQVENKLPKFQASNFSKFHKTNNSSKNIHTPSFLYFKKKDQIEKNDKVEEISFVKRTRSPSQLDKKYFTMMNMEEKEKNFFNKDFRNNSSLRLIEQSTVKQIRKSPFKYNNSKKEGNSNKRIEKDFKANNEREKIKIVQVKPVELIQSLTKIQSIQQSSGKQSEKKASNLPVYSPKVFNKRISLQSRLDLGIFSKIKQSKEGIALNGIPQADRNQELSRRDMIERKKVIREELCQSLNSGSELQLKQRLFQQFQSKYGSGIKLASKRNKSLEDKDTQPSEQMIPPLRIKQERKCETEDRQCPQKTNVSYDGYRINIGMRQQRQSKIME